VRFIDYGNDDTIPIVNLRELITPDLLHSPPQAKYCYVTGAIAADQSWCKEAIEILNEKICYEQLNYRLIGYLKENPIIELYLDPQNTTALALWLIEQQFAIPFDVTAASMPVPSGATYGAPYDARSLDHMSVKQSMMIQQQHQMRDPSGMNQNSVMTSIPNLQTRPLVNVSNLLSGMTNQPPPPGLLHMQRQQQAQSFPVNTVNSYPVMHSSLSSCPSMIPQATLSQAYTTMPQYGVYSVPQPASYATSAIGGMASYQSIQQPPIQSRPVVDELMNSGRSVLAQTQTIPQRGSPTIRQYRNRHLTKRQRYDVIICYIRDPESFYIRLVETQDDLISFMSHFNQYYSESRNRRPLQAFTANTPCVALHEGLWYRGLIVDCKGDSIVVRYVDYGTQQTLRTTDVFQISDEFMREPVFAVHSCFQAMTAYLRGIWTPEETTIFQDMVLNIQYVGVLIDTEGVCQWELFNPTTKESVAQALLDAYAELNTRHRKKMIQPAMQSVDAHQDTIGRASVAVSANHSMENAAAPADSCPMNSEETLETQVSVEGLPVLNIPASLGGFVDVVLAHIESVDKFFCQLQNQAELIEKLSGELNTYYNDSTTKPYINPTNGTMCIAKYSLDNCWYRGFVLERPTPALVEIYFVDYGNTERVQKTDLRVITKEFELYPPRAFQCKLKGVSANAQNTTKFKECAEGCKLTIKLDGKLDKAFEVILFDTNPTSKQECNINDFLNGRSEIMPSKLMAPKQVQGPQRQAGPVINGFGGGGSDDGFHRKSDYGNRGGRSDRGGSGFGGGRYDGESGGFRGGRGGRGGGRGRGDHHTSTNYWFIWYQPVQKVGWFPNRFYGCDAK
uniref:Tudor domain-containing protein n=1 Tax=Romanomermis culicivorax TaxID=13658 RepID=A0A915HJE1_ROMCU